MYVPIPAALSIRYSSTVVAAIWTLIRRIAPRFSVVS
jgi:hypothetical protein